MVREMPAPKDTRDKAHERVQAALARRVEEHGDREAWIHETAAAIKVGKDTVGNWLQGRTTPRLTHVARLIAYLGPEFAEEVFEGFIFARLDDPDGIAKIKAMAAAGRLRELTPQLQSIVKEIKESLDIILDYNDQYGDDR